MAVIVAWKMLPGLLLGEAQKKLDRDIAMKQFENYKIGRVSVLAVDRETPRCMTNHAAILTAIAHAPGK